MACDSTLPKRIQRRRTKGWRMPDGAIYVGRPTRWGNPWRLVCDGGLTFSIQTRADAVAAFRRYCSTSPSWINGARAELRGHDLACWCPIISHGKYVPCHADVLLSISNETPMDEVIRENIRWAEREAGR